MPESLERLARNQALFREVNERIETIAGDSETVEFVCECSNPDCISTIELKMGEYERVRGSTGASSVPFSERSSGTCSNGSGSRLFRLSGSRGCGAG
jgi:hypothetical protein